MPNQINEMIARQLSDGFRGAEGMIVVSLSGLSVAETETLRESLAEHGVRLRMVRNRLALRALRERGVEAPTELFQGNVACAWGGPEAAIQAAKVVQGSDLRRTGKLSLRGGLLEGNLLDAAEATALASLPGKNELRAKLLGTIGGPLRGLVSLLVAPHGALARVLQARVDAAPAAPAEAAPAAETPA